MRGTAVLSLGLFAAACTPVRMAVPQDVSGTSDEIAVTDRSSMSGALVDESFKMGPYQIVDVNRKWQSSSSGGIGRFSAANTKGGYAFGVKAPEGVYKGQCASQLDEKQAGVLGIAIGSQNYSVLCECDGPAHASFVINADTTAHYKGMITARNTSYAIEGIYTTETGSSTGKPVGYNVHGPQDPVGAVEVSGKGRVWLAKALDPGAKADVACLFAGLLLYKEPSSAMDK
jgi:hypothetical protein